MAVAERTNTEELAAEAGKPEGSGGSALPGLVRELIRTPGFKELLTVHLRDIDPENARELVRSFLWEDVAFTMSVLGASPKLVNWLVAALLELGAQLDKFTLDILRDFLAQLGRDLDVEKLRELPGAYAPLLNDLLLEDREALDGLLAGLGSLAEELAKSMGRTARKVGNTADFGKIRVGLSEHFEARRKELAGAPELANPIVLSNLLGAVPPLANYGLRVLTRALQGMNLPAEILANAVFQLLEDIDMAEMGGLVNALAALIGALHRGNLVLGRDEPRFREVLGRVSRELVDNVDGEAFKEMLVALKEDGAVIGGVLADYAYATPESAVQVARGLYLAVGAALRAAAETMRRLSELPDGAVGAMVEHFEEAIDPRELARLINYNAALSGKAFEAKPDVLGVAVGKLLAGLDTQALAEVGKAALLQLRDAALADPKVSAALEPAAVGARINRGLAAFNRFTRENPDLIADRMARTMAVVDVGELGRAAGGLVAPLMKAMAKNGDLLKNVVRPVVRPLVMGALALGGLVGGAVVLRRRRR